ncbi:hypothetical protein A9Q99_04235 [Gammaproteobacteria bacterium 45_16_T64]|nr:hypothetical protein A9Q99_04235 [Gammaproteobacteria bacterium 45_16_T64]
MYNNKRSCFAALLLMGFLFTTNTHGVPEPNEALTHTWDNDITIPSLLDPQDSGTNQIQLPANIFIPLSEKPTNGFPAIIFINSWTLNEHQYKALGKTYSDNGYVVLSYTTRGFQGSPGLVDTAGAKDIYDAKESISWLIDNYPVNQNAIAMAGISYGSGIALLTATQDERLAAVIAMSTWGSLRESLWAGETPQETWLDILLGTVGWPFGKAEPEMGEMADNMWEHKNIDETLAWAAARSPITYIDQINARTSPPAIYVANNLQDYLFQPNSIIEFLGKFEGPWRADFSFGIHGQGEAGGVLGEEDNYPWTNATAWLDHHLKGVDNGIDKIDKISTVVHSRSRGASKKRESFDDLPVTTSEHDINLTLVPFGDNTGFLSSSIAPVMDVIQSIDTTDSRVGSSGVGWASLGAGLRFPIDEIDPTNAIIFSTGTLTDSIYLRGEATLTIWANVEHNSQFFAYLLALNEDTGQAHWIGHAPLSWHLPEGESELPDTPVELEFGFYWTANDINSGEKLILVVDGHDPDYWRYPDTPATNTFIFGDQYPANLTIPRTLTINDITSLEFPEGYNNSRSSTSGNNDASYSGSNGGAFGGLMLLLLGSFSLRRLRKA